MPFGKLSYKKVYLFYYFISLQVVLTAVNVPYVDLHHEASEGKAK